MLRTISIRTNQLFYSSRHAQHLKTIEYAPGFERLGTLRQPSGSPAADEAAPAPAAAVDEAFAGAAAAVAVGAPDGASAAAFDESVLSAGRFDGESPSPLADTTGNRHGKEE